MPKIFSLEEIKQIFIDNNLIPLFEEYKNNRERLLAQTQEGYKIFTFLSNLKQQHPPRIFNKTNPYTIQNIHLWCKLNNKPFELVSEEYIDAMKKLRWKCLKDNCGEIFEMSWTHISQDHGCPYCVGQQVGLSNCLAAKRPDLVAEWHPTLNGDLTPYDVTFGSHKDIWWQCENNHIWQAKINNRNKGENCPYCNHQKPCEYYNLLISNSDLCEEWDYNKNSKRPEEYTPKSGKIVNWKCKECGHEWKATIHDRNDGKGCPQCAKRKRPKGENCYNWQGGQSDIKLYLRSELSQWKLDSLNICNYKCIITGLNQKDIQIHHLVPFSKIFKEIWKISNLPKYQTVGEYTNKELLLIIDLFAKLHDKYGLGVCISKELHVEFHHIYGVKNFTPEDFYEFYKLKTGKDFDSSFLIVNKQNNNINIIEKEVS